MNDNKFQLFSHTAMQWAEPPILRNGLYQSKYNTEEWRGRPTKRNGNTEQASHVSSACGRSALIGGATYSQVGLGGLG
jgi:hypothetical protein